MREALYPLILRILNWLRRPEKQTDEEFFAYRREKEHGIQYLAPLRHTTLIPLDPLPAHPPTPQQEVHHLVQDGRISSLIRTMELPRIPKMKGASMNHATKQRKQ